MATMWKVPTTGARAAQTAVSPAAGSIGSCTWTTSNRRERTARAVRPTVPGESATRVTVPSQVNPIERPSEWKPSASTGPSAGARISASTPRARSAAASPATCVCTPPGTLHE